MHFTVHFLGSLDLLNSLFPCLMQFQLNGLLEEKVQPYVRSVDKGVLPQSIVIQSNDQENKVSLTILVSLFTLKSFLVLIIVF